MNRLLIGLSHATMHEYLQCSTSTSSNTSSVLAPNYGFPGLRPSYTRQRRRKLLDIVSCFLSISSLPSHPGIYIIFSKMKTIDSNDGSPEKQTRCRKSKGRSKAGCLSCRQRRIKVCLTFSLGVNLYYSPPLYSALFATTSAFQTYFL
jgi:hypothetical protein